VDRHHRIQRANRAAAALLGLEPSQLTDKYCYEVLHDRAEPVPGCPVQRVLMTGKEERCDGTTFKIYLPLVEKAARPVAAFSLGAPLSGGSETILLVENEEGVRDLAGKILELKGDKVIMASNPTEAVQVCERHEGPIHLLLTDVIMPTMSGRQLAEHVAFLRPELKVLYMSGYTDNAIVPHGILEEGTPFLQKPFTPDSLTHKVREVLDAPQQAA
jgi:two-component system cell cycle sensor histidine kinase/response regulator CckA